MMSINLCNVLQRCRIERLQRLRSFDSNRFLKSLCWSGGAKREVTPGFITMSGGSWGPGGSGRTCKPVYKLRGHTRSILCCVTSRHSPDEVVTSSEDGSVRVFDLRSQRCSTTHQDFGGESVASVSLNPGNATELYAAAGGVVYCIDRRLGSSGRALQRYEFNLDEINQVVVNQKGSYVAAADDSGEIKVIDVHNCRLYRTLRGGHTNICSAVQFHPQKPWEVISGGLDSKIVKWDFSKGKHLRSINLVSGNANAGQLCNPPFVHALAIPEGNGSGDTGRVVAVARGDGAIEVYDLAFETVKSTGSKESRNKDNGQNKSGQGSIGEPALKVDGLKCHFDGQHGGHTTSVSSVAFAAFGGKEHFLASGSNDKFIKIWNLRYSVMDAQSDDASALVINIQHGKKINWLSTIDRNVGNLAVADTSKVLSVYDIL